MYTFLTDIADPYVARITFQDANEIIYIRAQVKHGSTIIGEVGTVDFHIVNGDDIEATFYGLRSIICGYMKEQLMTMSDFTIVYYGDNGHGEDTDTVSVSILYNRFRITGEADELLSSQYLLSSKFAVIPSDQGFHFPFTHTRVIQKIIFRYYMIINGALNYVNVGVDSYEDIGLSNIVLKWGLYLPVGTLVSDIYYIEVFKQGDLIYHTIFPMKDKEYHHITFRNRFNLLEDAYIPCAHSTEQSKEYETGTINGKLIPYDIERTITHTLSADAALPQLLPYLREICISEDVTIDGESVIVTEHDIPSTDTLGEPFAFSLKYQSNIKNGIDQL